MASGVKWLFALSIESIFENIFFLPKIDLKYVKQGYVLKNWVEG